MDFRCLKIASLVLATALAAHADDRSIVVIQGKGTINVAGSRSWTLCESGRISSLGSGASFRVPAGKYLVITEASFTVRGGATKYARAADFRITMKTGPDSFDLAEFSDRLLANLDNNTVSKRFSPGLMVLSGAEVTGTLKELQPGGVAASLEVNLYGYLVPTGQGW